MSDERLTYRRTLGNVQHWPDVSIEIVAFWLHRITGWLLLGWIGLHLAIPTLVEGPTSVWFPTSKVSIVVLLTVVLFHGLNGLRLMAAEAGFGAGRTRQTFLATVMVCVIFLLLIGWLL